MTAKPPTNSIADYQRVLDTRALLHQILEVGPVSDRLTMAAAVLGSITLIAVAATIRLIAP
jgi:hypothetical protein